MRGALCLLLAAALALGVPAPLRGQSVLRVAVLPPSADSVREETADLLGEFLRQEVSQDSRFRLVAAGATCADAACAAAAARSAGADRVLWSRIERRGAELTLVATATIAADGRELGAQRATASTEEELFGVAGEMTSALLDALARELPAAPAPPVVTESGGSKRWWWIGGAAAVVVGGLVALLGGSGGGASPTTPDDGEEEPTTLPGPPAHQ